MCITTPSGRLVNLATPAAAVMQIGAYDILSEPKQVCSSLRCTRAWLVVSRFSCTLCVLVLHPSANARLAGGRGTTLVYGGLTSFKGRQGSAPGQWTLWLQGA